MGPSSRGHPGFAALFSPSSPAPPRSRDPWRPPCSRLLCEAQGGPGPDGEHGLDLSVATCSLGPLYSGQPAQLSTVLLRGAHAAADFRGLDASRSCRGQPPPLQARLKGMMRLTSPCSALPLSPVFPSYRGVPPGAALTARLCDLPGPQPSVKLTFLPSYPALWLCWCFLTQHGCHHLQEGLPTDLGWGDHKQILPGVQGPHWFISVALNQSSGPDHQQPWHLASATLSSDPGAAGVLWADATRAHLPPQPSPATPEASPEAPPDDGLSFSVL